MKTLSAEEYKKQFGDQAYAAFGTPPSPSSKAPVKDFAIGAAKGAVATLQGADTLHTMNRMAGAKTDFVGMTDEQRVAAVTPTNAAQRAGKHTEVGLEIAAPFAPAATRLATDAAKALKPGEVLETAAKNIQNIRFGLTNLDAHAEKILKETSLPEFERYYEIAAKAATDPRATTPLEVAGEQAQKALGEIQIKLSSAGAKKGDMMKLGGITGFKGNGLNQFREGLQSFVNNRSSVEGDSSLVRDIKGKLDELGKTPSAGQVDKFIDYVQDKIYTSSRDLTVPVTDKTRAALRGLVQQLNADLKLQLPKEFSRLNDEYSRLIDLRNELNAKLGKEGERGGSLLKRVASPADANTKKLFEEVRQETGIDLVKDATLARFVMESVGDVRQKSLLKQLDIITQDAAQVDLTRPGTWLQYLRNKADMEPADAAREVIKRSTSQQ